MLSVVIPAYNEEEVILATLQEVEESLSGLDYEIVVVDDGSTDSTYEKIAKHESDRIKVVRQEENRGKGYALVHGFSFTSGELIAFIDADGDLPPRQIFDYVQYMRDSGADVVVGSKRHPLSKVDYPLKRRILSGCYQLLNNVLFRINVTDTQVGLKLFKREVLEKVLPRVLVKKYAFDLELLVVADHLGYKITEAPIELNFHNSSNINWRDIWHIFVDTCAIFYRLKILKYYK
jgi:glycosyltransferase involved in cell wall biosynthesis